MKTLLIFPFIKTGFSMGKMDTDYTADENVREISCTLGGGLSYKATDRVYLLAGIDYIWRKWSDIFVGFGTLKTKDHALKPYLGINYKF